MRILLVDDSRTMRGLQKNVLAALAPSIAFSEAGDGLQALGVIAASSRPFDLVLLDWNMPNMDGATLVARIRENDRRTPLIVCVPESDKRQAVESLKSGVNGYLIKPFTPESLLDKAMQAIQTSRAMAGAE